MNLFFLSFRLFSNQKWVAASELNALGGWGSSGKKNPGDVSTQALRLIGRKRRKKEETGPKQ